MRIKTRNILTVLLFTVLMTMLALLIVALPKSATTASAATYSDSGIYEFDIGAEMKMTTTTTGVPYHVYLYGSNLSSNNTKISSGALFSFKPTKIEIIIPCGSSSSYHYFYGRVYNVSLSGPISFSFNNVNNGSTSQSTILSYSLSGLSEGKYTFSFTKDEHYHAQTNPGGTTDTYNTAQTFIFEFTVDVSAPIIKGASLSQSTPYINSAVTVKATDEGSGVQALYMKAPDASTFTSVGTSKIISDGSTNGTYTFYATDKLGNKSQYYYVNFDDTVPFMQSDGADFGGSTNLGFTVSAIDNMGSVTLYYRNNTDSWQSSGSSFTLPDNGADGTYSFYAEDNAGNRTYEQWIQVGMNLSGQFIKSDLDNSVYFTWDRVTWTAMLDDAPYTKGTWIKEEGEHTIKLSSQTTNAIYPYFIDHYYLTTVESPSCTTGGYLQYDCLQCGDSYTNYSIEETGHYYVASTTVATCTSGGYTVYNCTRCGDTYTDNYTNPLGHNYESTYQPATCTDYGKTVFTCQVCGSGYYETDGSYPTGHSYVITISKEPTCTEDGIRVNNCDKCGDSYETVVSANGHNYGVAEIQTLKGKTTRVYTCLTCGRTYKQELGNQYEEVSNYVEYLFNQYSPYMWWVLLASAGVWSIVMGVFFAIAQKNEEKEKSKKMIVNYVVGLVVIAIIVVACPSLIRGIAALVT